MLLSIKYWPFYVWTIQLCWYCSKSEVIIVSMTLFQIILPRVLHVPIAVVGDYYVMKLTVYLFGHKPGMYAVSSPLAR